ncbi:MAG: hypothetical protein ACM3X5_06505, partial [Bacillota bacterium]
TSSSSSIAYRKCSSAMDRTTRRRELFKGEKAGNIPFEQADYFVTLVNASTAAALGIRLIPEVRLRADRIIE